MAESTVSSPAHAHGLGILLRLDRLPTEILAETLRFACVDGGRTGRSLALTSRHISAVARRYRFQSVLIAGPLQLERFMDAFARERDIANRRVLYLFLAAQHPRTGFASGCMPAGPGSMRALLDRVEMLWCTLLRVVAPTVRSLAVLAFHPLPGRFERPFGEDPVCFPELSQFLYQHAGRRGFDDTRGSLQNCTMPALEVLHSSSRAATPYILRIVTQLSRQSRRFREVVLCDLDFRDDQETALRRFLGVTVLDNVDMPSEIDALRPSVLLVIWPERDSPNVDLLYELGASSQGKRIIILEARRETSYDDMLEEWRKAQMLQM